MENEKALKLLKTYIELGDQDAFKAIYEGYYVMVYNVVLRIIGDSVLVEDVIQETFTKFSKQAQKFDSSKCLLSTYLIMIAKGVAFEFREREKNKKFHFFANLKNFFYYGDKNLNQNIFTSEIRAKVAAIINTLPQEEQEIFVLRFDAGLSVKDISVGLNINENTVKTRISKTKKLLIAQLGDILQ